MRNWSQFSGERSEGRVGVRYLAEYEIKSVVALCTNSQSPYSRRPSMHRSRAGLVELPQKLFGALVMHVIQLRVAAFLGFCGYATAAATFEFDMRRLPGPSTHLVWLDT